MPHGHCYFWLPSILWLHVLSDLLIALSYYSIPLALFVVFKRRKDLSFNWIFICFAIFIFACGTTHLMQIWTVWNGTYRLSGLVKLVTAFASVVTAILLWPLIPKLLAIPSAKQLAEANKRLREEAAERQAAQEKLTLLNAELEKKIHGATLQLQLALAQKEEVIVREKDARSEAEKASRLKDEFLSTLSHELRTPLSAISSWLQILSNSPQQASVEALPIFQRNVAKLSSIIDDLLDMSMIMTGSICLSPKSYDLMELANEVVDNLKATADSKGIIINIKGQNDSAKLRGDVVRVRQIIWNLLTNAIKFTPNGKAVTLSITSNETCVSLAVVDEGKGIAPEFLPQVFDRFRQETSTASREYSGLGLGLSIAKQLAELHGGSIVAESGGLGLGATFTLTLPVPL